MSDSYSNEEEDQHDLDIEITPQEDIDLDPASIPTQQRKWAHKLIKAVGDVVGNLDDRRRKRSHYQNDHVSLSHTDPLLPERRFMMMGLDPQTFKEACHDPIWQATMDEEFDSLQDNKTWELVPLPIGRKLVQ